jgi:CDP-glycerol glycerophosphotransferase (TagB/SpsB family)
MRIGKLLNVSKYWGQALLLPIYWLSFLTPRDKKIWLFGSTFGNRFADNPKYFYLYLNQYNREDVRCIWITKKKEIVDLLSTHKLEVYYYLSLRGIWFCLRGKVYIYDNYSKDISFWLSGGAKKINLWHGSGNKKTNYDNKFDIVRHPKNRWDLFKTFLRRLSDEKPHHFTLATSPMMADIFTSAFHTDLAHIILEGYPRNDMLFPNNLINIYTEKEQKTFDFIKACKLAQKKIIIYMPTFRNSEAMFFDVMNLETFNKYLMQEKLIFCIKLHPKSKLKKEFHEINYSNIKNIDAAVDPYTILYLVDLLVTDYSSIYSDYLMLNRPTVLFPYDYQEYTMDTRECYFDYEEYMPEIKAYNMNDLMKYIILVMRNDSYEEGRLQLRDRIFTNADGHSSERLYRKICKIIN